MKNNCKILVLLLCIFSVCNSLYAQKNLQINKVRFNKQKIYRVYIGEELVYKLKGQHIWRKDIIINLQDSLVVFENETTARLNQFKKIRLYKNVSLARTVQIQVRRLGVAFFALHSINQLIMGDKPVFSPVVALISGGVVASSLIFREMNFKRIRINNRNFLVLSETNFQNLNSK